MVIGQLLHFMGIGSILAGSALGVGLSQAEATRAGFSALRNQIAAKEVIRKNLFVGLLMIESAGILAFLFALLMMAGKKPDWIEQQLISSMLSFSLAIVTLVVTYVLRTPVISAMRSTARQPFFAQKIMLLMLIIQSTITVPLIFTFVIALLIKSHAAQIVPYYDAAKYIAAILTLMVGAFGPSIGQSFFGEAVCEAIGYSKAAYNKLFTYIFLTTALMETPFIFCMIDAIIMIYKHVDPTNAVTGIVACASAAFSVSVGSAVASALVGYIAAQTVRNIGHDVAHYALWVRTTFFSQMFVETAAIYAWLVSLLLLIKVE